MSTVPQDKGGVEIDRCRAVVTDACGRRTHPSSRVLRRKNCMSMGEARASDEPTTTTWSLQSGERWSTGCSRFNPTTCVGVVAGRRKEEIGSCGLHCTESCVEHCCKSRSTHIQPESTKRFHNGTHEGYICLPVRHLDHQLSGIYHDELQDDKVPVSVHESPPAHMSQTAPLLRMRICSLGTRYFCAAQRTACLLGVISNTT
jgi:hypothetical protein